MSGRVGDIAVDPVKHSTWYVAAASGGVWKTTNSGTTWSPIFDGYGSYSIGCVVVDPGNHLVVWVGTGENNSQRSVGYGDGLYKSIDGGASFSKVGLERSEHIAKVLIDPRDSNVVYVAVQGPLWNPGGDRGLYTKTTDGGKTWKAVLAVSENRVDSSILLPRISCCLTGMLPTSGGAACARRSASRRNTNCSKFFANVISRHPSSRKQQSWMNSLPSLAVIASMLFDCSPELILWSTSHPPCPGGSIPRRSARRSSYSGKLPIAFAGSV